MEGIQAGLFDENNNDGDTLTLAEYAEQAYLDYAVSVVRGRALPEVADGQKPVQRRILYAMQAMGLGPDARPVKSARVVGDVLGKYHPHGDQAAYDAMVRMAQNFVLRYPLIDGQGNFGSRDGDNAAAMRYTEARLTAFSRVLLDELHEGTVDFAPNYDGSQEEPLLLPARLPVVLLNGASGIAVGMATEIPPHNLNEVVGACIALLKKPSLSDAELQQLMPGPDFPGGGQIITPQDDIAQVYQSGRGSIKVRARWHIEELARGQWQLVVHELPPFTSAQKVLEEIDNLTNPRPRGNRKTLSSEQQQTRSLVLSLLDTVRDESGKDEAVRLVFEPKSSRIDHDEFINLLLTQTSLEGNVTINLVCIGTDSRPAQKGLRAILQDWLDYRLKTITRRSEYRLEKVSDRIHVLEGRMVVYLNVDAVIQTIRDSDEPRDALMQRFQLTQRQADDILEMRLRQLARLEGIRIEKELAKLRDQQTELEALLASPTALKRLLTTELRTDAKTYGDERRTLIQTAEQAVLETPVVDEALSVVVSRQGWLRTRQGHGHDASLFTFK
ncbi:MAG TPA: DNA topoisomerase IV subunit A, partial [Burkholderiaceae bacterium]|nr:DNA topoisomerase IV subunit A [Burkholderiaceae bacterium]